MDWKLLDVSLADHKKIRNVSEGTHDEAIFARRLFAVTFRAYQADGLAHDATAMVDARALADEDIVPTARRILADATEHLRAPSVGE